jgi:DNA polymerase III gamma/tau subunit
MKEGDPCHVTEWLDESTKKVAAGQHVLAYIEHVMEGQLPTDMEMIRDLYLQGHQLTRAVQDAVNGLEQALSTVRTEIRLHDTRKCSCGKAACGTSLLHLSISFQV